MDPIRSSAATSVRRAGGAGATTGTGVCRVTSASAVSIHMSDSLATSHRSLSAEERTSQMTSDAQDTYQASHNTRQPASAPMASQHSPASRPRYSARRVVCGLWWGLGTVLGAISALINLTGSHFLQFLGAAAITALIGWYDYRIWTFKAKWLMFLIIF